MPPPADRSVFPVPARPVTDATPGAHRGALVTLPAEAEIVDIAAAGLDFVLIDLVQGPSDETALVHHLRLGHTCGLLVVAIVEDPAQLTRLARLGVDAAVMPTSRGADAASGLPLIDARQLTVLTDPAVSSDSAWIAVDLAEVRRRALARMRPSSTPDAVLPLVLLAGQLGDVSVWDEVVERLPAGGRYIGLRIDLDDSIEDMAASVLAAAPPRFALAGHSLGGIVALQIVRSAADRVDRLALLNASGREASDAQLTAWSELQARLQGGEFDAVVDDLATANLLPTDLAVSAHRLRWHRMARVVGPAGLLRQLRAQRNRPDSRPGLGELRLPTLVLSGSADIVCRPELQRELVAGLPDAEHVTLEGAGHMTPLTAPDAVAAELTRWLRR